MDTPLPVRGAALGRVPHRAAARAYERSADDHLLLLEHPHVYTLGVRADMRTCSAAGRVGADLVRTDRGGDVTYHGPGQLVGYPILSLPPKDGGAKTGMADTVAYVRSVEQLLIGSLADLGLPNAGRLRDYPGVWVDPESDDPRKVAAIGVRLNRGRTMHGFALNVARHALLGLHRPVRHPRQAGHLAGRRGPRRLDARGGRRGRRPGLGPVGRRGGEVERQDVVWRVAHRPLDAFSRGEASARCLGVGAPDWPPPAGPPPGGREGGAGEVGNHPSPRSVQSGPKPAAGDGVPVRLQGRLAQAGVTEGLADRRAQARVAALVVPHRARLPAAKPRCATWAWSRCARRPAVPTSSSAGTTAPPRS